MDIHRILARTNLDNASSHLSIASQFIQEGRSLPEVLSCLDRGLVSLHDARVELARFREKIYLKHQENLKQVLPVDEIASTQVSADAPGGG